MDCRSATEKLDAYLDGELSAEEQKALREHFKACPACALESLDRLRAKRAIQAAGERFVPNAAFRSQIQKSFSGKPARSGFGWIPAAASVFAVLVIVGAFMINHNREQTRETRLLSEVADLHVAALASANPVDVVSSDRHTVKPWFEGKLPFTFNLPELTGSPFTLVGGRLTYLNQSPGAELIFRVRQHQISVFIFQERAVDGAIPSELDSKSLSFNVQSWSHNGLRYFAIGDSGSDDLNRLSDLLKAAG